jgi:hypothetical protein
MKSCFTVWGVLTVLLYSAGTGAQTNVYINGQQLTVEELASLQQQIGPIAPGYYAYDYNSGCWANLSNGATGCLGNSSAGIYTTPYGSGEIYDDGSWDYYSNPAGGGVGGTSDGCIYTTYGWSNC